MKWVRRLLKSPLIFNILAFFAAQYIRLVFLTNRWEVINKETPESYIQKGKPFIVCFWHGRLGMLVYAWAWKEHPFHMLLSAHRDGRLIGETVGHFGISPIWGSTQRGGGQALREMVRTLRKGGTIGITPDGPRGPRQVASPGIITLAKLAQADIIPVTFSTSRCRRLDSWDRFLFPLPCGNGAFLWGDPLPPLISNDPIDHEAARHRLEREMTDLQNRADQLVRGM